MTSAQGFGLLGLVATLTAIGQICFKRVAIMELPFLRKIIHPLFLTGGLLFGAGPVLTSLAAKVIDYSILYAFSSLNIVFVLFLSRWLLGERIDRPKMTGGAIIIIGLWIMVMG